jgi:hypothetical protein
VTQAKAKGVYPKLAEAIAEVDSVTKDGFNSHFNYPFTSAEAIYRVVRGPLLSRGLVVIPSTTGGRSEVVPPKSDGTGGGNRTIINLHFAIVDSESGEEIEVDWIGEGFDSGDKGPYKAYTGGIKTWLRHLFQLPADDDPESDANTNKRTATRNSASTTTPATEKQRGYAEKLLKDSTLDDDAKHAVWVWGMAGGKTLCKPRASEIIEALKEGQTDALLGKAGYSDLPADTEGLQVDTSDFEHDGKVAPEQGQQFVEASRPDDE